MNHSTFTLEDDLSALPKLVPTAKIIEAIGDCLSKIQTATTEEERNKNFFWALGYIQALKDIRETSATQTPDLRDLVFRAKQRCTIK